MWRQCRSWLCLHKVRRPLDDVPNFLEDPAGYEPRPSIWTATISGFPCFLHGEMMNLPLARVSVFRGSSCSVLLESAQSFEGWLVCDARRLQFFMQPISSN